MKLGNLVTGRLVRRYKRFLADIELDEPLQGESLITVHCPNTGAMTGCAEPGSRVWLQESTNTRRKYRYTWELVQASTGAMICIHSARANALVVEALEARCLPELADYTEWRREARMGTAGSRADLLLSGRQQPDCYVEIKSVTLLHDENGIGIFPDAVSLRARKHLSELMQLRAQGFRAILLFVAQHTGILEVAPADRVDPAYGQALRQAMAAGVEVMAYGTAISPAQIRLTESLPVRASMPTPTGECTVG